MTPCLPAQQKLKNSSGELAKELDSLLNFIMEHYSVCVDFIPREMPPRWMCVLINRAWLFLVSFFLMNTCRIKRRLSSLAMLNFRRYSARFASQNARVRACSMHFEIEFHARTRHSLTPMQATYMIGKVSREHVTPTPTCKNKSEKERG
jgi:hypothetical protein